MSNSIKIAPITEALTFARTDEGRILAVTAYIDGQISGVDLSHLKTRPVDDPIDLMVSLGRDALASAVMSGTESFQCLADELVQPINLAGAHIAVGTNYKEHAQESAVTGSPFLFPKLVSPTGPWAEIPAGKGMLDFEVELCLVPMTRLAPDKPVIGGLILGNDVTDRAVLMRGVDPKDPQSGKGFTDGKSAAGYLPVGDLFVAPVDLSAFLSGLTLQLSVNGVERQRAPVTDWIWDLDEIIRQARLKRKTVWAWREGEARLAFADDGAIPARTLIMAGTPAGTVFQGVPGKDRLQGLIRWILSGFRGGPVPHVVDAYVARNISEKTFLQPGDKVTITVDRLGRLDNRVVN